jgi:hypothetical protein
MTNIYERKYERKIEEQASIVYKECFTGDFINIKNRYGSTNDKTMTPLEVIENYTNENNLKVAIIRKKLVYTNFEPITKSW